MLQKLFRRNFRFIMVMMSIVVFAALVFPTFAQDTITLDVDANDFIGAINTWLPVAVGVVVIGVGIRGAFALAGKVGDMITDSFR